MNRRRQTHKGSIKLQSKREKKKRIKETLEKPVKLGQPIIPKPRREKEKKREEYSLFLN